jgi:Zn ribbon nucleic-acid-binding protein
MVCPQKSRDLQRKWRFDQHWGSHQEKCGFDQQKWTFNQQIGESANKNAGLLGFNRQK